METFTFHWIGFCYQVVVWKRYNDFKRLYKSLFGLHKALHRREQFPTFAKPKLFGRFDESVIEERRQSALTLLEFIGLHSYLYKSKEFVAFIKDGKVRRELSGDILKPSALAIIPQVEGKPTDVHKDDGVLQPTKHPPDEGTDTGIDSVREVQENSDIRESQEDSLDGVWNYPQVPDNISLNSYDDTDTSEVDSALGTPLPVSEISFFDPLTSEDSPHLDLPKESNLRTSSSWLFDAMNTCAELEQESELEARSDFTESENGIQISVEESQELESGMESISDPTLAEDNDENNSRASSTIDLSDFDPLRSRSGSKVEIGKGDIDLSGSFKATDLNNHNFSPKRVVTSSPAKTKSASPFKMKRKSRSDTKESVSTMDLGGKEDYIYLAANQICLAQDCEASAKFELAFSHYKAGVGILLQGVQSDKNKSRRDAVRRKTAQYLLKAEDLYNRHLSKDVLDEKRWADDSKLSPTYELDPSISMLKGSSGDLKLYKVLGTIDKVLLVMDKNTDETYVMKTIHKSVDINSKRIRTFFPAHCPYMVSLYKFFETDCAIHLLLQHATGGKLWNYIGAYIQGRKDPVDNDANQFGNVYAGTKLHEHDNSSQDFTLEKKINGDIESKSKLMDSSDVLVKYSASSGDGESKISIGRNMEEDLTNEYTGYRKEEEQKQEQEEGSMKIPVDRLESFSSAEDGFEGQEVRPASLEQKDFVFQELLQDSKSNLEQFSIISSDSTSSDCRARVDSFVFDRSDIIQEENEVHGECVGFVDQDNVFGGEKKSDTPDQDDSEIIVKSARELLKSVERTLSQTDAEVNKMLNSKDNTGNVHRDTLDVQRTKNVTEVVTSGHSSATVIDDSDSNEASIYDVHHSSSSTDSDSIDKCHKSENVNKTEVSSALNCDTNMSEFYPSRSERTSTLKATNQDGDSGSESSESPSRSKTSRSSTLVNNSPVKNVSVGKLSLTRMNSKELSRSASMEHELTSPPRSRQRTVSDVFKDTNMVGSLENVRLPESCIRQWIAEIVVALGKLHEEGIVCRDLRPDNILLGDRGHVLLTYFCQLNQVDQEVDFTAVDELYVAPEVKNVKGYTESCDWWSLGALMYELIFGRSLSSCHPGGINLHTQLYFPDHASEEANGLLRQLLCYSARERLGSGMNGAEEIKAHPFFSGIDWNQLEQ
ncbi:hypothetical protein FSP39_022039 [Pinctada imbricata]|uniref:Ribosomal protein S6 kinase delta-1 n=1 Tax=Pinctada imbricata TaxID=66713 RepID=A0AA89BSH4_PINIB|nr:hypothetical protein FSP39_022039 [Pinctada imbricata]